MNMLKCYKQKSVAECEMCGDRPGVSKCGGKPTGQGSYRGASSAAEWGEGEVNGWAEERREETEMSGFFET